MVSSALLARSIFILCQLGLAFFLFPEDMGEATVAFTAYTILERFTEMGLRQFLVKYKNILSQCTVTFLKLLAIQGGGLCLLLLLLSPVLQWLYAGKSGLYVLILAPSLFVSSFKTLPMAILQSELRFSALASVGLLLFALRGVLSLGMAMLGFGSLSLIVPLLLSNVISIAYAWYLAKPVLSDRKFPLLGKRAYLRSLGLAAYQTIMFVSTQVDYLILGFFVDEKLLGLYYFAFAASQQVATLLGNNLSSVGFTYFARSVDKTNRTAQAFVAIRVIGVLAGFACGVQAIGAYVLGPWVLPVVWQDCTLLIVILSVGMYGRLINIPADSIVQVSKIDFRRLAYLIVFFVLYTATCFVAASGNLIFMVSAISLFLLLVAPTYAVIQILQNQAKRSDQPSSRLKNLFLFQYAYHTTMPGIISAISVFASWWLANRIASGIESILLIALFPILYGFLSMVCVPQSLQLIWNRSVKRQPGT